MALTFEWDSRKAQSNLSKHGVSFEAATTIFGDSMSLTMPDPEHSIAERRFITLGRAFTGKLLVVVHTDRGDNIRVISARRANKREQKFYEQKVE